MSKLGDIARARRVSRGQSQTPTFDIHKLAQVGKTRVEAKKQMDAKVNAGLRKLMGKGAAGAAAVTAVSSSQDDSQRYQDAEPSYEQPTPQPSSSGGGSGGGGSSPSQPQEEEQQYQQEDSSSDDSQAVDDVITQNLIEQEDAILDAFAEQASERLGEVDALVEEARQQAQRANEQQGTPNDGHDVDESEDSGDPYLQDDTFYGEGGEPIKVASYLCRGRLCSVGAVPTSVGYVPYSASQFVGNGISDGPVTMGAESEAIINVAVEQNAKKIMNAANKDKLATVIEGLCIRARNGDQNAMAYIAQVSDNAKRGNPQSMRAFHAISKYLNENPAGLLNMFGSESNKVKQSTYRAAVVLANGPPLTNKRVSHMADVFGAESEDYGLNPQQGKDLFLFAVKHHEKGGYLNDMAKKIRDPWAKKIIEIGRGVGEARSLQAARMPNAQMSRVGVDIGWESGE